MHRPLRVRGCKSHGAQVTENRRTATPALELARRIRNTKRWAMCAKWVLANFPLCADPFGAHGDQDTVATQADHIIGLATQPELAFERSNLQALCATCHARKSAIERRGVDGNHRVYFSPR